MKWQADITTVITGASGGIGKAFVQYCADQGHRLVLIDKDEDALLHLAIWTNKNYPNVSVHPLAIDISSESGIAHVTAFMQEHDIAIDWFINNAGLGHVSVFRKTDADILRNELNVNVIGTTMITHSLLPFMNRRRKSFLLFMSSLAAFYPLPIKNTYGASKAYITNFAGSLSFELASDNISVSICCPGPVNSTIRQFLAYQRLPWKDRFLVKDPEFIVKAAIKDMLKGKKIIVPGLACKVLYHLTRLMPSRMREGITRKQFRIMRPIVEDEPLVPGQPLPSPAK